MSLHSHWNPKEYPGISECQYDNPIPSICWQDKANVPDITRLNEAYRNLLTLSSVNRKNPMYTETLVTEFRRYQALGGQLSLATIDIISYAKEIEEGKGSNSHTSLRGKGN